MAILSIDFYFSSNKIYFLDGDDDDATLFSPYNDLILLSLCNNYAFNASNCEVCLNSVIWYCINTF